MINEEKNGVPPHKNAGGESDDKLLNVRERIARILEPSYDWEKDYLPHTKRWHGKQRTLWAADRILSAATVTFKE